MNFLLSLKSRLNTSDSDVSEQLFLGKRWASFTFAERWTVLLIALTPALYLGVRHWVTNLSVLAVIMAIYSLVKMRDKVRLSEIPHIKAISLVFLIYIYAIFISQLGRQDFITRPYLDQGRWILGLPFFIFIYHTQLNFAKVMDWAAPICIFSAYVSSVYIIPSNDWGDRATVSFMDPLMFGFTNLSLALMCFASVAVDIYKKHYSINTALKIAAFVLGVYLSIRSGSRSGWAAFPVVIIVISYALYKPSFWRGVGISLSALLIMVVIYYTSIIVKARIDQLVNELMQYPWAGGVAQDSSVSMRITFYRLGNYYFTQSPLFGWGERGYGSIKDATELLAFSTQFTRDFAFSALFHSEWITQSVRFGALGLIGVFWVFFWPLKMFTQFVKSGSDSFKVGYMGLAYMLCLLAASIGDEVFNHKMSVTFSAIVIAGLLATALSLREQKQKSPT